VAFFLEREFFGDTDPAASGSVGISSDAAEIVVNEESLTTYMQYRFDEGLSPQEAVERMGMSLDGVAPQTIAEWFESRAARMGRRPL